jgi:hypothetical protein
MNNAPRIASRSRFSAFFAAAFVTLAMLVSIDGLVPQAETSALMAEVVTADRA